MTTQELTKLGFTKIDLDDDIRREETGCGGIVYEIEFPRLKRTISTTLIEPGEKFSFMVCDEKGNILKRLQSTAITPTIYRAKQMDDKVKELIRIGQNRIDETI